MNPFWNKLTSNQAVGYLCQILLFGWIGTIFCGCDRFLISPCALNDQLRGCSFGQISDAGSNPENDGSSGGTVSDMSDVIGADRKFEWAAKILVNGDSKYVGFITGPNNEKYVVSMKGPSNPSFEVKSFNLRDTIAERRLQDVTVSGLPKIPGDMAFGKDTIRVSGGEFWFFRISNGQKIFRLTSNNSIIDFDKETVSGEPSAPQPFFHPEINVFSVLAKTSSTNKSRMLTLLKNDLAVIDERMPLTVSSFLVGDLDSIDPLKNGVETISFSGRSVRSFFHVDDTFGISLRDPELSAGIDRAIAQNQNNKAADVEAGCIGNLNGDLRSELVYSLAGELFVLSYLGRIGVSSLFRSWPDWVVKIKSDEKVKSIAAVELTGDKYPELIVETDKAVHFYLNNP